MELFLKITLKLIFIFKTNLRFVITNQRFGLLSISKILDTFHFVTICLQPAPPPLFDLKIVYFYVIEVADSESDLGLHDLALVSKIQVFARTRVAITIENYKTTI